MSPFRVLFEVAVNTNSACGLKPQSVLKTTKLRIKINIKKKTYCVKILSRFSTTLNGSLKLFNSNNFNDSSTRQKKNIVN